MLVLLTCRGGVGTRLGSVNAEEEEEREELAADKGALTTRHLLLRIIMIVIARVISPRTTKRIS